VCPGLAGAGRERLDDVRRRPGLRVAAAEVDECLALLGGPLRHAGEKPHEVLLGKALDTRGARAHAPSIGDAAG
jgi:hypothetical protein